MKNKENEKNNYECIKCETGQTDVHGLQCNKNETEEEQKNYNFNEEEMDFIRFCIEGHVNILDSEDKEKYGQIAETIMNRSPI